MLGVQLQAPILQCCFFVGRACRELCGVVLAAHAVSADQKGLTTGCQGLPLAMAGPGTHANTAREIREPAISHSRAHTVLQRTYTQFAWAQQYAPALDRCWQTQGCSCSSCCFTSNAQRGAASPAHQQQAATQKQVQASRHQTGLAARISFPSSAAPMQRDGPDVHSAVTAPKCKERQCKEREIERGGISHP